MDFDPWRWVAIPCWGLVLLVLPPALGIFIWQIAGFPAAAGVVLVLVIVLRFIFSHRLLDAWHLIAALNGRYIVEPMPVQMVRLRQSDDREIQLRVKGQIRGGTLMEGDRIRALGVWRTGVFRVRSVVCERTGARMVPCQPHALRLAVVGLCLLGVIGLWLQLAGVPWVAERAHQFRSEFQQRTSTPLFLPYSP